MDDNIVTQHPQGKAGKSISRQKYEAVRGAIVEALREGDMTFKDLIDAVHTRLEGRFEGSIPWYVTCIKLDLEARGVIARVPRQNPQVLRLLEE